MTVIYDTVLYVYIYIYIHNNYSLKAVNNAGERVWESLQVGNSSSSSSSTTTTNNNNNDKNDDTTNDININKTIINNKLVLLWCQY